MEGPNATESKMKAIARITVTTVMEVEIEGGTEFLLDASAESNSEILRSQIEEGLAEQGVVEEVTIKAAWDYIPSAESLDYDLYGAALEDLDQYDAAVEYFESMEGY